MSANTSQCPKRLGDYDIIRLLGEGGMGRVFLALSRSSGAQVVVKLLHEEYALDPVRRRAFQHELEMMRRFRHRHAVNLLDASTAADAQPYLVLEYVWGKSLEDLLAHRRRWNPHRVGSLLGPLCVVLQAAHDQGILHRDLTAANVMIIGAGTEHESIKVMDFGLARLSGFYVSLEKLQGSTGIGGGTPDYVCPEQVRGEGVDARGDIYSLGVLLYKALTGFLPFESARTISGILLAQRDQPPPAFAVLGATDVPTQIEAVVRWCLAKNPAERPASARELAQQFGAALGRSIVDHDAFDPLPASSSLYPVLERRPDLAAEAVIDRFQAWMPEAVAAMKLRGFVSGVGGEVLESVPGVIRVRLADTVQTVESPGGLRSWFRSAPPPLPPPTFQTIELRLRKLPSAGQSLVDIAVIRLARRHESSRQRSAGHTRCEEICKELRAYLMIGR
jgi:serine/threonine-protein kinase